MAVGAVEAVGITAEVVGLLDFAAEAVGIMDLVPMVAGPTWVMGGVVTAFRLAACMRTDLLVTA